MRPTWNESRFWKAHRARCSAPARRQVRLRYITNKPKLDVTEGNVDAGYAITAHGDPSTNVEAMINVPLIADTLAVRGVIYDDSRGGYIDNVPGTFTRRPTDIGIHYANYTGGGVPPNSPGHQQQQHGGQGHQSGHLPGYPCGGAVPDQ